MNLESKSNSLIILYEVGMVLAFTMLGNTYVVSTGIKIIVICEVSP